MYISNKNFQWTASVFFSFLYIPTKIIYKKALAPGVSGIGYFHALLQEIRTRRTIMMKSFKHIITYKDNFIRPIRRKTTIRNIMTLKLVGKPIKINEKSCSVH